MVKANNPYAYRERFYRTYLSKKVRPGSTSYDRAYFANWSAGAKVRLKGWLPTDFDVPILDLGCGSGVFLAHMIESGYSNLMGVDISAEQIEEARAWCDNALLMQADVRDVLADREAQFGLITGFDIVEHLGKDEQFEFFDLIYKALRPGGRLILQSPNAESPWIGAVAYGDFSHEWFYTPRSLADMFRQTNFVNFEARPCGPYIHGVKSLVRWSLWQSINVGLRLWNLAETGSSGSGIYTRVFVATAQKGEH